MKLYFEKFEIAQARTGKTLEHEQLGISRTLLYRARNGAELRPTTVFKLAQALGCDPAEIVKVGE